MCSFGMAFTNSNFKIQILLLSTLVLLGTELPNFWLLIQKQS